MLGWSVSKVKQFSALRAINAVAWGVIVTSFEALAQLSSDDKVTEKVTMVTFSDGNIAESRNDVNVILAKWAEEHPMGEPGGQEGNTNACKDKNEYGNIKVVFSQGAGGTTKNYIVNRLVKENRHDLYLLHFHFCQVLNAGFSIPSF